jgi:hypothetical protein
MKHFVIRLFILLGLAFSSCNNSPTTQLVENKPDSNGNEKKLDLNIQEKFPLDFIDSIRERLLLPHVSIARYTIIDSVYLGLDTQFSGDTVYSSSGKYFFAAINYDDRKVCIYKMILVFNKTTKMSTDYKIVKMDCDIDQGAGSYNDREYSVLNDSSIVINNYRNTLISGDKYNKSLKQENWTVDSLGKFALISK